MRGRNDREFSTRLLGGVLIMTAMALLAGCAQKKGDEFYAEQRYEMAADLYVKAAEQGDVAKMMKLAEMYASGKIDYHRDYKQAVYWYTKAADRGIVAAMFELGFIYEYGQGDVKQDHAQALHWYQQAAAHGHAYSEYRLAHIQAEDLGDVHGDAATEAYTSFLAAQQMAKDCDNAAECRIINGDLFNYRWQLERYLSDAQKQQARERLARSAVAQPAN